jgi:hypothetical protein
MTNRRGSAVQFQVGELCYMWLICSAAAEGNRLDLTDKIEKELLRMTGARWTPDEIRDNARSYHNAELQLQLDRGLTI